MREIKFRAWDTRSREYRGESNLLIGLTGWLFWEFGYETRTVEPGAFIIEQYTGLKDRNGKEIYEGDILEIEFFGDRRERGVIEYCAGAGRFMWLEPGGVLWGIRSNDSKNEVVGNIHQHPELLKGNQHPATKEDGK